jgi:hypothetical protein
MTGGDLPELMTIEALIELKPLADHAAVVGFADANACLTAALASVAGSRMYGNAAAGCAN